MLCQHCNERESTTHYKKIVNGIREEAYFCTTCAHRLGYDHLAAELGLGFGTILGNFLGASSSVSTSMAGVERCPQCGSSYNDVVSLGMVGCEQCYQMFYDKLIPSIENLHGRAVHRGKVAQQAYIKVKEAFTEQEKLERGLKAAIEKQDFELAAQLRDKLKALHENITQAKENE